MRALSICTTHNRRGKSDGREFIKECQTWERLWKSDTLYYGDEAPGRRRRLAEQFLESAGQLGGPADVLAIFGHGTASQIVCTGHGRRHLPGLVDALTVALNPAGATILLYACLTGRDFGIADELDVMCEARGINVRTLAHLSPGHTSMNPQLEDSGEGVLNRGIEIVSRASHLWPEWRRRLREDPTFRFTFWTLTQDELFRELSGRPRPASIPENVKNQW